MPKPVVADEWHDLEVVEGARGAKAREVLPEPERNPEERRRSIGLGVRVVEARAAAWDAEVQDIDRMLDADAETMTPDERAAAEALYAELERRIASLRYGTTFRNVPSASLDSRFFADLDAVIEECLEEARGIYADLERNPGDEDLRARYAATMRSYQGLLDFREDCERLKTGGAALRAGTSPYAEGRGTGIVPESPQRPPRFSTEEHTVVDQPAVREGARPIARSRALAEEVNTTIADMNAIKRVSAHAAEAGRSRHSADAEGLDVKKVGHRKIVRAGGEIVESPSLELLLNRQPLPEHLVAGRISPEALEEAMTDVNRFLKEWQVREAKLAELLDDDATCGVEPKKGEAVREYDARIMARRARLLDEYDRLDRSIMALGAALRLQDQTPEFLVAVRVMCDEARDAWGKAQAEFLKKPRSAALAQRMEEEKNRTSRLEALYLHVEHRVSREAARRKTSTAASGSRELPVYGSPRTRSKS